MSGFRYIPLNIAFAVFFFSGCQDIYEQEKYRRPDWLEGKLYTQISTRPDLTDFTTCLQLAGFDTILDVTGSYTIFAPTNQAFDEWFNQHPEYGGSFENIPPQDLENLVERHILQNIWSLKQIQSLDIYGWIDPDDPENDKPRGYKRQTIQRDPDKKYYFVSTGQKEQIVDSTLSSKYKMVYSSSRKYAPLFFDDYFGINDLRGEDYEFYYGRPFESGQIYFGNARIISPEIFAENGFVYEVDRVTDPLYNAEQILDQEYGQFSYHLFRDVTHLFSDFSMNEQATFLQPEAKAGGLFDTLYNLNYPDLVFNFHEELTGPNTSFSNYTVRYQNGLLAPTDAAFQKLIDEVLTINSGYPHWKDFDAIPSEVKRIILNAHMTDKPVYRTNIERGFRNGASDVITVDEANIVQKYYGSNCTFLGLDQAIIPRAFSSITGPVYLRPGFSTFLYAMEYAKTLPALKEVGKDYSFYILSDDLFSLDSSLMLEWTNRELNILKFRAFDRGNETFASISRNQLTKMILNQVGISQPRGIARKEFIENLAGNFIIVNNEKNTVSGGEPNNWGYNGDSAIEIHPLQLEEETDNGKTYDVSGWFYNPIVNMYSRIISKPHFYNLLVRAGLYDNIYYSFPFLTEGELYTVFVPTEEALEKYNTDTLSQEELQQFVKYHFVRGTRIWTDGSSPSGLYETLRVDESSTEFSTKYTTIHIETGPDIIRILDMEGKLYTEIQEQERITNVMIATNLDNTSNSPYDYAITGVMHDIDTVLIKQ